MSSFAKLRKAHPDTEPRFCCEAGSTGFGLQRNVERKGIACLVAAPSLIPSRSGDKIKTDRRAERDRQPQAAPDLPPRLDHRASLCCASSPHRVSVARINFS